MITKKEQEELRGIFPSGWAKEIARRLNAVKIIPARAKEYNPKIVRQVFLGDQEDIHVELQLFRFRDEILTKRKELEELRGKKYNEKEEEA